MTSERSVRVPIHGMDCPGSDAPLVERALAATPGVLRAYVNPATEAAYVDYDDGLIDPELIADIIRAVGYTPGCSEP